jgi:hypothetical protein
MPRTLIGTNEVLLLGYNAHLTEVRSLSTRTIACALLVPRGTEWLRLERYATLTTNTTTSCFHLLLYAVI